MQLNKLSIELLADAFTAVEIVSHFPFAVIGQEQTLKILRRFLLAMRLAKKDGRVTLWSCPLIQDEGIDPGCIVLGCHLQRFVPLSHYALGTVTVIDYCVGERIFSPEEAADCPVVWGLRIWLA